MRCSKQATTQFPSRPPRAARVNGPYPVGGDTSLSLSLSLSLSRQEAIAYNGAAAIIQGLWRHHKNGKLLLRCTNPIGNLAKKPKKTAGKTTQTSPSTSPTPTPRESSSSLANLIGVRPFSPVYRPPPQGINNGTCSPLPLDTQPTMADAFPTLKNVTPGQKPWRPTEAEMSSLYVVWNAFTALLTTFATRRATKTKLVRALSTPAAITLATFSRVHRAACIGLEGALTSSTGASLVVSPDPARFQCARSLERVITVAGWRLAEAARIRAESLLAAQSAATKAIGGLRTEDIDAAAKYAREAVLEATQVRAYYKVNITLIRRRDRHVLFGIVAKAMDMTEEWHGI